MTYTPYPIAAFKTGLDGELQPWLLPVDAQFELFDGYVYLGVWQKRKGYSQFATGQRGGAAYTESRMIHTISAFPTTGAIDSMNKVFTAMLTPLPIARGYVTVVGTNPVQSFTDNGSGEFIYSSVSIGTIDYATGALSITLPTAPTAGSVTVTFSVYNGLPVMGVMNFYTQLNVRQLIVADTTYVNRYNPVTNRLDDISPATLLTGDQTNFFSWTNYPTPEDMQRLLFVNYKDPIQAYDGTTVTVYPVYTASVAVPATNSGVVGNGTVGPYTINTPANTGIVPGTLIITEPVSGQTVTDDQFGNLKGNGTGTVNYLTGTIVVTFNAAVLAPNPIKIAYQQMNTPIDTCRHIFQLKDRLVLLSIVTNGTEFGLQIRVSGFGAFSDVFTPGDALGAGVINVPDQSFIMGADFNRDDLIFFTNQSVWSLKYTNNDAVPFVLQKIDDTRGSEAPYGTITYLNRTDAQSPRGLIVTDGYAADRNDAKLPNYSFNNIDQANFQQCFAGSVDADRDHYLIHPSPGNSISDVILVQNYQEENFSVYNIPLSCMGEFVETVDTTWNDLLIYPTWDAMAAVYGNWYSFGFNKGSPFAIGGGHHGQIVKLNVTNLEDYPCNIWSATVIDAFTLQITTDFQEWQVGDIIYLEALTGMTECNDKQAQITEIVTPNYTFNLEIDTTNFNTYISGGVASKVITFSTKTKKFNPFVNQDKKVRCGWVYFYVSTTNTSLTVNQNIHNAVALSTSLLVITIPGHGYSTGQQVYINGVGGMTQLNGNFYYITVIDSNNFSLNDIDTTGFGTYTTLGYCSVPEDAELVVNVIVNDTEASTLLPAYPLPYQVNLTSHEASNGIKKWCKIWVNQVGRFIQLQLVNQQAGAVVEIQSIIPGFQPVGRLI